MVKVLFVCMGNICRSPTAQAVFESLVEQADLTAHIMTESAGTHDYNLGEQPDRRAQKAGAKRGIDMSHIRATQFQMSDYEDYDYIVAMDQSNYDHLLKLAPKQHHAKISLLLVHSDLEQQEIPDPYYEGLGAFDSVFDLVHEGAQALLNKIIKDYQFKT